MKIIQKPYSYIPIIIDFYTKDSLEYKSITVDIHGGRET